MGSQSACEGGRRGGRDVVGRARFDLTSDTGIDRVFGGLGRNLREAVCFFVPRDPRMPPYPEEPAVTELL